MSLTTKVRFAYNEGTLCLHLKNKVVKAKEKEGKGITPDKSGGEGKSKKSKRSKRSKRRLR